MERIKKLVSEFPCKRYLIDLINIDDINELLIENVELIIDNCYESNNVASSSYELDAIYQLCWERINMGMYEEVTRVWRTMFSVACVLSVFVRLRESSVNERLPDESAMRECLLMCDMSLIVGGQQARLSDLCALMASQIHEILTDHIEDNTRGESFGEDDRFDPYESIPMELRDNIVPLERIERPSITEFLKIVEKQRPVILTGVIDHWPAISSKKWSIDYIRHRCGHRTVPVEIGSHYANSDWRQELMTINQFIDRFFSADPMGPKAYLAQHYLFSQIPELFEDIDIPDYCFMSDNHGDTEKTEVDINGWFGPRATVSPLHHDPKLNFLCQIFGKKYVKLYEENQTEHLYPIVGDMLKNTSQVDVLRLDLEEFPLFKSAVGFDGVIGPGDMLFIPPRCWHYVQSLSCSFSVNFWWK